MKKLGNAILMIDIPFNIAGIILCMWRINIMLHSDLQRLIDEKGGIGAVNTLIVFSIEYYMCSGTCKT